MFWREPERNPIIYYFFSLIMIKVLKFLYLL